MEERVVTIKFDATVDGKKVDVCGANILLGINEIPRIELLVPPTRSKNSTPLKPNVSKPTISTFSDLYKEFAVKAEGLKTTGNVTITINTDSTVKSAKPETLTLNDWVLSGVGLSSVSAVSAPHMTLILQHPVCRLTKVGSIYETPKSLAESIIAGAASVGSSFLDIVKKVYEVYRGTLLYFKSPDNMPEVYRQHLGVGDYDPKKYFVENSSNLFLCNMLPEAKARMAAAIGRMVCPMGDGSSTWDMLVRVASEQMLSIIQNQDNNFTMEKGLVLEPTKPWRTDNILTLVEDRCSWTDIPGQDMFKLVGVMARKLVISGNRITTWACTLSDKPPDETGICDVLYCPVQPENADGRIMKTSAPQLMYQTFMEDAIAGGSITTGFAQTGKARLNGFDGVLAKYCRAVYETSYGSMNIGRAQMALGFKDVDGKWLLPGNTCKFVSKGKEIYYGYVRNIVHTLSTKGGCSTTLNMSYVRPTKTVPTVPNGNISVVYDG